MGTSGTLTPAFVFDVEKIFDVECLAVRLCQQVLPLPTLWKTKKPLSVSRKGFRLKKGTDLLSHLLRQYH
ncbi:hypothetical protein ACR79M_09490, partial [Sphingobacterium spiritivorum]